MPVNFKLFTRPTAITAVWSLTDGDYYELLASDSANIEQATIIDVGTSQQYTDNIGAAGVTKFYWIRAVNRTVPGALMRSQPNGPLSATTNVGTAATIVPVAGDQLVRDQTTGFLVQANQSHNR